MVGRPARGGSMNAPEKLNLLVVSDLHVSEGRRAGTKRFSRNEDFFFDPAFARFLRHYQGQEREGTRWHLIVAGDFLDLLQVLPPSSQPGGGYGLPCGEAESIYKLQVVARGHPELFEALAGFVAAGHRLTILKGNHDPELHYAGVQAAFLALLREAFARSAAPSPAANAALIGSQNVIFADWFYYEENVIWIEHGNQYEDWNAFRTFLSPLMPARHGASRKDDIDLPLGSLFVRYLFNRIELAEPFADNIKPTSRFVRWLLTRHPITALKFLFTDGVHMVSRIRRALGRFDTAAFALRLHEHEARLAALASASGIMRDRLQAIDALRAKNVLEEPTGLWPWLITTLIRFRLGLPLATVGLCLVGLTGLLASAQLAGVLVPPVGASLAAISIPYVGPVLPWSERALGLVLAVLALLGVRWMFRPEAKPEPDYLVKPANAIAAILGVPNVVMGHTHDPQLCPLADGLGEYFNTGSWTKVFSEDERLVREDVELVFLQGVRTGKDLKLRLMEWDDAAGEPRLLKLFEE